MFLWLAILLLLSGVNVFFVCVWNSKGSYIFTPKSLIRIKLVQQLMFNLNSLKNTSRKKNLGVFLFVVKTSTPLSTSICLSTVETPTPTLKHREQHRDAKKEDAKHFRI